MTLSAVKETVITVNMINYQGINSSFDLRNIKWDYKSEYELEIPIQSHLERIEIQVKSKIEKYKG